MESFVHLRKGKTPRRLQADLDGLKDDELVAAVRRPHRQPLPSRRPDGLPGGRPAASSRCRSTPARSTATCCASCTGGAGLLETEFGPLGYREGDRVYLPKACTWRVPDSETTLLMIEATDEFRQPPPGSLGRHFPFDPSQVTIPNRPRSTQTLSKIGATSTRSG